MEATKPESDKELLEYQKQVCYNCKQQIYLKRGIFKKGCMIIDVYAISYHSKMIKDNGECIFFQKKSH